MYARARNAVISIACKGSSAVNVVHARAQKFCNFQGSCGMQGLKNSVISSLVVHRNAVLSSGSTYFNSQDFLHARVQNASISTCKGSKCSYFVRGLCMQRTNSKCFNFQDLAISRFCACKAPYTAISWDFVHAGARRASLSRAVCTNGLQMLLEVLHFPGILCTQGFHMLQFPGTLAHKDSKC